jgi:hypothetical protein
LRRGPLPKPRALKRAGPTLYYNPSLAFEALFHKTGEEKHRAEAFRAVQDALEVYREAGATFYVAKAERQLARLQGEAGG